jgi:hypothetical protein
MEKGLLESMKKNIDNWTYLEKVYYQKLPFKCKIYHEYDHFSKIYPKSRTDSTLEEPQQ